jgi:hypothetical protein
MTVLAKRVQILFPESLWDNLVIQAQYQNRSVGALIREAVEKYYFSDQVNPVQTQRVELVAKLIAMQLPVSDWQQMEQESTTRGFLDE